MPNPPAMIERLLALLKDGMWESADRREDVRDAIDALLALRAAPEQPAPVATVIGEERGYCDWFPKIQWHVGMQDLPKGTKLYASAPAALRPPAQPGMETIEQWAKRMTPALIGPGTDYPEAAPPEELAAAQGNKAKLDSLRATTVATPSSGSLPNTSGPVSAATQDDAYEKCLKTCEAIAATGGSATHCVEMIRALRPLASEGEKP